MNSTNVSEYNVGSDRVVAREEALIIHAAREMPDWQVREFCRIPIYFRGVKLYVRGITRAEPPFRFRYELAVWPPDLHEESSTVIHYGEAYVAARDAEGRTEKIDDIGRAFLLPFYPLLGFLWGSFKDQRLERFGFNPASITSASLYLAFALFVGEAVFVLYLRQGFLEITFGFTPVIDYFIFAVAPIDTAMRFNQVLSGHETPDGFLEWVFRGLKRRAGRP
jgi:hypothetical protein